MIPSQYIESGLYKAEVKYAFGKLTILENKLIDYTITFNNIIYMLPYVWVKPASLKKVVKLLIGRNFVKHVNGRIIVQGEKKYYMLTYGQYSNGNKNTH